MSTVRVYELAKEAGLDSKTMTAKLIELGYDVKSHSSTVDEKTADDIRVKLGLVKTEVEEKRIQAKGRTTIIRRRTKAVKEEVPVEPVIEEAQAEEQPPAGEETVPSPAKSAAMANRREEEPGEAVPETDEPKSFRRKGLKKSRPRRSRNNRRPPKGWRRDRRPGRGRTSGSSCRGNSRKLVSAAVEAEKAAGTEEAEAAKKVKTVVIDRPKRGIARVIKKAAIQIPVEETPAEKAARRPVKGKPSTAPGRGGASSRGKSGCRPPRTRARRRRRARDTLNSSPTLPSVTAARKRG